MLLPLDLADTLSAVDRTGKHEEQVGETINVGEQRRRHGVGSKRYHAPLEAATNGTGKVKDGARRRATGQDKATQRRQLLIQAIDPFFQPLHAGIAELDLGHALGNAPHGIGEASTEREQVPLQLSEHLDEVGINPCRQRRAEMRTELVDFAARVDARVRFGDPRAVEEARLALIARASVNRHDPIIALGLTRAFSGLCARFIS